MSLLLSLCNKVGELIKREGDILKLCTAFEVHNFQMLLFSVILKWSLTVNENIVEGEGNMGPSGNRSTRGSDP